MSPQAGSPSYLVTAYRWGCTNEHAYHVYGGPDKTKANALARAEQADRAGKYGCVVWEFDGDGVDYKCVAYYPSMAEADDTGGPRHNYRIDYFERIGQFVDGAMSGKALRPDPQDAKRLTYQDVAPLPPYLVAEVERQRQFLKLMTENEAKIKAAAPERPS